MLELRELRQIVDAEVKPGGLEIQTPSKEEMQTVLQVLLVHQCIYPSTPRIGRSYELVRTHAAYFEKVLDAMGRGLRIDAKAQMVAVTVDPSESRYDWHYSKLKRDETMVLLALRLAYEEGLQESRVEEGGVVEITTDDIFDKLQAIFHEVSLAEKRLTEILNFYKRKGFVRLGEVDRIERSRVVEILPGIDIAAPDGYLDYVTSWAEAEAARQVEAPRRGEGTRKNGEDRGATREAETEADNDETEEDGLETRAGETPAPAGQED